MAKQLQTPQEKARRTRFLKAMQAVAENQKILKKPSEGSHVDADTLLCGLLKELGYSEVVDVYNGIKKWYA